jgi:hypothetical protein
MSAAASPASASASTRRSRDGDHGEELYKKLRAVIDEAPLASGDAIPLALAKLCRDVVTSDVRQVMRKARGGEARPKTTQKAALKVSASAMELALFVSANHVDKVTPVSPAFPAHVIPGHRLRRRTLKAAMMASLIAARRSCGATLLRLRF